MSGRLFVGNLSFSLADNALRETFARVSAVERAEIVRDRFDGRSRGYGFVEMATAEGADLVLRELNGRELDGRPMRIEPANSVRRENGAAPAAHRA